MNDAKSRRFFCPVFYAFVCFGRVDGCKIICYNFNRNYFRRCRAMHSTRKIKDDLIYVGGSDRRLSRFGKIYSRFRAVYPITAMCCWTQKKTVLFDTADDSIGRLFCET